MFWRLKGTFSTTSRYRFRHEKQLETFFPLNVVVIDVVPAQLELEEGNPIRFTFTISLRSLTTSERRKHSFACFTCWKPNQSSFDRLKQETWLLTPSITEQIHLVSSHLTTFRIFCIQPSSHCLNTKLNRWRNLASFYRITVCSRVSGTG